MINQSNIQNVVLLIKSELAGLDKDVNHCSVEEDSSNFQLKIMRKEARQQCNMLLKRQKPLRTWR